LRSVSVFRVPILKWTKRRPIMYLSYRELTLSLNLGRRCGVLNEFLRQYFIPYFSFQEAIPFGNEVFATLTVETGRPSNTPDFTLGELLTVDGSKGFLHCRGRMVDVGVVRWVALEPFGCVVAADNAVRRLRLWGPDEVVLRIPTLRLVEDLFSNELQNRGAILVHASAVVAGDTAVLAIGNKGAGKTTILSRLLGNFSVDKMANDNVCLWVEDGRVIARGWPAFYKVQIGTIATTPQLTRDFPDHARHTIDDDEALWSRYEKVALYPCQAAERFNTTLTPQAPLGVILFPKFNRNHAPWLEQVPFASYALEFEQLLQGIRNPNHQEWLAFNPVDESAFKEGFREILRSIDSTEVSIYALDWAPSLEDMLCGVPELRQRNRNLAAARATEDIHDNWQSL